MILIMKLLLNNTPIDVGMKFGVRSGAQVRTSGKIRVSDTAEQIRQQDGVGSSASEGVRA